MTDTTRPACGAELDGYRCTLAPHAPAIDHADQAIAPGGVTAASYTRAFWTEGATAATVVDPYRDELPIDERRILEDFVDRGITPRAIAKRRHRASIRSLVRRGLLTVDADGIPALVDEVAALVALGRACGDHDRPLPCPECH